VVNRAAEISQVDEFKERAEYFHRILEDTEPNIYDQLAEITEKKIELLKKAENIPVVLREGRDAFFKELFK
jgi:hypothetical protein